MNEKDDALKDWKEFEAFVFEKETNGVGETIQGFETQTILPQYKHIPSKLQVTLKQGGGVL